MRARRCFSLILSALLATAQVHADTPEILNSFSIIDLQQGIENALSGNARLPTTREGLFAKAGKVTNVVSQEVLQLTATLIVLGAQQYKAAEDLQQMKRLTNGSFQLPKADPNAPYCGRGNTGTPSEDTLCSGEFLFGFSAALGVVLPALGLRLVKWWLKKGKSKIAALNVITGVFSPALMLVMAQGATTLWSQAVKYLDNQSEMDQTRGLAGRFALAMASRNTDQFMGSSDGALLKKLTQIMVAVVVVNPHLRARWLDSLWRFGFERGEFVGSIASLMSADLLSGLAASVVGSSLAGTGAAAASAGVVATTAVAVTPAFVGLVVGVTFGIVTYTYIFEEGIPKQITRGIQDLRQWRQQRGLSSNKESLDLLVQRFTFDRYQRAQAGNEEHQENALKFAQYYLGRRAKMRDAMATTAIEKWVELKLETDSLEQKILVGEKSINDENLQKDLYYSANGKILSYDEIQKNVCPDAIDDSSPYLYDLGPLERLALNPTGCQPSHADQLKAYSELRALVDEAHKEMHDLSISLVDFYDQDLQTLYTFTENPKVSLPVPIAQAFDNFRVETNDVKRTFMGLFSVIDPRLFAEWRVTPPPDINDEERRKQYEMKARSVLDTYYGSGFNEAIVYQFARARRQSQ